VAAAPDESVPAEPENNIVDAPDVVIATSLTHLMSLPDEAGPPAPDLAEPPAVASPELLRGGGESAPERPQTAAAPEGPAPELPAPVASTGPETAPQDAVPAASVPAASAPPEPPEQAEPSGSPEHGFAAGLRGASPQTAPLTALQDQPDLTHVPGVTDGVLPGLFRDRTGEPALIYDGQTRPGPPPSANPSPFYADHPAFNRSGRAKGLVTVAAVAVLLAGGGVIAWAAAQHSGPARLTTRAASAPASLPAPTQAATRAPSPTPTPPPPTATASPPSSGMVAVTPAVFEQGDEPEVLAFLDEYFAAINSHDYQQYRSLLDGRLRRAETAAGFSDGYWSTTDTGAKLVRLAPASAQGVAATITFTSHQAPSDSPTHTSCTDWRTTLYLSPLAESYVIQEPPPSYRASYRSC
jgi:hypothetical protein